MNAEKRERRAERKLCRIVRAEENLEERDRAFDWTRSTALINA